jgi:hypothetical protein
VTNENQLQNQTLLRFSTPPLIAAYRVVRLF